MIISFCNISSSQFSEHIDFAFNDILEEIHNSPNRVAIIVQDSYFWVPQCTVQISKIILLIALNITNKFLLPPLWFLESNSFQQSIKICCHLNLAICFYTYKRMKCQMILMVVTSRFILFQNELSPWCIFLNRFWIVLFS